MKSSTRFIAWVESWRAGSKISVVAGPFATAPAARAWADERKHRLICDGGYSGSDLVTVVQEREDDDAETADVFLQCLAIGEIKYG